MQVVVVFFVFKSSKLWGTFCHMCFRTRKIRVQICDKVLFIDQTPGCMPNWMPFNIDESKASNSVEYEVDIEIDIGT